MPGFREEVLNVALARLLRRRGLLSFPETIYKVSSKKRKLPDVLVSFRGLRVVLEGKCDDHTSAEEVVFRDVQTKVDEGIGHIGIAIVYPAGLRTLDFRDLEAHLERSDLRFRVYNENGESEWIQGKVDLLASLLTQVYQEMIREDVVTWGAGILSEAIEQTALAFLSVSAGAAVVLRVLEMERLEEGQTDAELPESDEA